MKDMIRVVLVDPHDESRQALQRLLGGINVIWLAEVCTSYQGAARAVSEHVPDLTLVVLDSDPEAAIGLIQGVVRGRPDAVVLPASKAYDSDMILKVIRAGTREFLTLPTGLDELLGAIDRLFPIAAEAGTSARRGAQVVAVTGATGGVGCTLLAVNLATAMAKASEKSVVLADFDLLLGAVDTCLDILPDHTLLDVAQNVDRLDLTLLKRSMIRHSSGLYVLPHPVAMEDATKIEPDSLRRVVGLLKAAFDTVVIDTSKGLQASDSIAFEMADVILLVVQLDLICLRNSARLLHLFRQFDGLADKVRVVVNRVGSNVNEIGLKKAEETLSLPVSWQIPNSFKVINAARSKGVTIDAEAAGCRAHRAVQEIARALQPPKPEGAESAKPRKGRFAAIFF